jgi:6-phosphogluconate dehydrogenase (decarboxylating)
MSSIAPLASQQIAAALAAKGIEMLDAPVSGGQPKAVNATLSVMVGGKPEVFDRCVPVFKAMANNTPDYISSDCQLAGHHIEQGMEENGLAKAEMAHPLTLIAKAYGL